MLEAFAINSIYHAISFISLPVMLIALFVGWKSINTRCLLIFLVCIEFVDTISIKFAIECGSYYYFWVFLSCWAYIFVVLARRIIVANLKKYNQFFKDVYYNFYFTKQEGALLFIYLSCSIITFIALVEVSLYTSDIIASMPFTYNLFSPLLTLLCLLEAIVVLWLSTRMTPVDEHVLEIKRQRKKLFERKKRDSSNNK